MRLLGALFLIGPVLVAMTACGPSTPSDLQLAEELNIYNWEEYFGETTLSDFEEEYGVKVNLHTFEDEEEAVAAIQSDPSAYDLVVVSDSEIPTLVQMNALAPVEHSNIPNLANLYPQFSSPPWDPDLQYSVPYLWGTTGLAVNREFVEGEVSSWGLLFDPRFQGHVAMLNNVWEDMGAALIYQGHSINTNDPDAINSAAELLRQQLPLIVGYMEPIDLRDALVSGDVWVALEYSGEGFQAADSNENVEYIIPEEGAPAWVDSFVIPVDSPHKHTAEVFLNYVLRPEVNAGIVNDLWYATANQAAEPYIDEEILADPAIYPSPDVMSRLEFWEENLSLVSTYNRIWSDLQAELGNQ
jgi:spermidine/putrescine-binding protein